MPNGQESNIFFAFKIFCEWDFNICRTETAKVKQQAIYTEIKVSLYLLLHAINSINLLLPANDWINFL